jgi:hypothetical protein
VRGGQHDQRFVGCRVPHFSQSTDVGFEDMRGRRDALRQSRLSVLEDGEACLARSGTGATHGPTGCPRAHRCEPGLQVDCLLLSCGLAVLGVGAGAGDGFLFRVGSRFDGRMAQGWRKNAFARLAIRQGGYGPGASSSRAFVPVRFGPDALRSSPLAIRSAPQSSVHSRNAVGATIEIPWKGSSSSRS